MKDNMVNVRSERKENSIEKNSNWIKIKWVEKPRNVQMFYFLDSCIYNYLTLWKFTKNVNVINPSSNHLPLGPGSTHNIYFGFHKLQLIDLILLGYSTSCC